jgi:hypothetical protein
LYTLILIAFLIQFSYPPTELLTPLNFLGDLPTCERLFQELLHCKAYAALLTCIPSLATEAMKLIIAVIKLADGQPLDLDVQTRKKSFNCLGESFKPERNQGGGQGGGAECAKAGGKEQSKWTKGESSTFRDAVGRGFEDWGPEVPNDPRIAAMRKRPAGIKESVEISHHLLPLCAAASMVSTGVGLGRVCNV